MGLTQKIMLVISLVIVALVATTLAFTTLQADRLAHATINEALKDASGVWEAYQTDRYKLLKLGVRPLANDPAIKALIEENPDDFDTISDTLAERGKDIGANLFLVTDPAGLVIGSTGKRSEISDLSADPLLKGVLGEHQDAVTLWRRGNKLFHAVAVPMLTGGDLKGVLVAGYEIDRALAEQLGKLTHCEIAFVAQPVDQPAQLSASSLGGRESAFRTMLVAPFGDSSGKPFNLDLAGERFVAVQIPLKDATGAVLGSVVALRSLAREMAPFNQFRQSLVLISVVVMVAALGLAYFVATRITGPVRTLVKLVERARDGSYSGAVSVATNDEIGALSRSFNSLLAELREKEQLIHFLREGMTEVRRGGGEASTLVGSDQTSAINAISAQAGVQVEKGKLFAGRYEILSTLGKGGMGIVYRAEDKRLDDVVALKVLRPEVLKDDPTLINRFKEELKLARKITHRNILRTHDFGDADGTPYISMEYLEGVTLKDLILSKGALPVGVGLRICKQMCSGLEAAHRQGVVHRDIKPQNMLIVPETGELKIMDFGIAQRSEVQAEAGLTTDGMVMGTPDYMAPEQAQARPVDLRSDVYALGVVFFEVFTGKLPFRGETLMATVLKHIQEPAPDPRTISPRLPEDLAAVIMRCMEKDPARRFQKVADILQELNAISSRVDVAA